MRTRIASVVVPIFTLLLISGFPSADTTYVSGEVSGVWDLSGSPYLVSGDIVVPADLELVIEPGVRIVFEAYYRFIINGRLDARGNETDSIGFTALLEDSTWGGLRFVDSEDTSFVQFCRIEHGDKA